MPIDTQALQMLSRHRRVWRNKPVLRRVYNEEFFARLLSSRVPGGICVEVGGGPGFFKELLPSVFCTDLIPSPWLDAAVDAQRLPFKSSSISNIFGLDILHHIAEPMMFLNEVQRVLIAGGRLALVEPWITPFSYFIYRYLHQEGCDLTAQPRDMDVRNGVAAKDAFDGNPAIPFLLFGAGHRSSTLALLPQLTTVAIEPFCLFAYVLTFGFKPMNLLPGFLYGFVSSLERRTLPLWSGLAALRVLLVLEKKAR